MFRQYYHNLMQCINLQSLENGLLGDIVITWLIILLYQRARIRAFFYPCSLACNIQRDKKKENSVSDKNIPK